MQVILLAAGMGQRLQPITNTTPKCLVKVNDVPLIVNALNILSRKNIDEILIVVGYLKEKIIDTVGYKFKGMNIVYIENNIFMKTNNIYSLYLTYPYIHSDILLIESDLMFHEKVIDDIIIADSECNVLVSKFNPLIMDGTCVEFDKNYTVKKFISKKEQKEYSGMFPSAEDKNTLFKTVNIYKMSRDFVLTKYFPMLETYIKTQTANSYYEVILGILAYCGNDNIKAVVVDEQQWGEVDNETDLKRAEKIFITGVEY